MVKVPAKLYIAGSFFFLGKWLTALNACPYSAEEVEIRYHVLINLDIHKLNSMVILTDFRFLAKDGAIT